MAKSLVESKKPFCTITNGQSNLRVPLGLFPHVSSPLPYTSNDVGQQIGSCLILCRRRSPPTWRVYVDPNIGTISGIAAIALTCRMRISLGFARRGSLPAREGCTAPSVFI